ncbi:MAG: preprotein translocase subunit YajC [Synergistaceae bacterium]|nr:preprotein translocase subunit YajC [Synergistaceae bacterium]
MGMLLPLAVFVLIFYFFIIRPQKKRQKQHDNLISGISRGDQVVTIGGFFGTVREVRDDTFLIEIAEGVRVRVLKSAVQTKKVPEEQKKGPATSLEKPDKKPEDGKDAS